MSTSNKKYKKTVV